MADSEGTDDTRKFLLMMGYNKYKIETYLALFKLRTAKVSDISKKSGVPQSKIYLVLDALEKDGLIKQQFSENKIYTVIHPNIAIEGLIQRERERLQTLISLKTTITSLFDKVPECDKAGEFFEIIRGRDNVLTFLAHELEKNTREAYWTLGSLTSNYTPVMPIIQTRKNDVDIRIIAPETTAKPFLVRKYMTLGAKVRLLNNLESPIRFSIYDHARLAFTLTDTHQGYLTIWTNSKAFVENLSNFFLFYWKKSRESDV